MILRKLLWVIICSLFLVSSCLAYDYYEIGKKAYTENNYEKASLYFIKVLKNKPDHLRCRYYYAQTLINLNRFDKAQKEYEKLIELAPFSNEAKLASLGISKIEKYKLVKSGVDLNSENKAEFKKKLEFKAVGDSYIENAFEGAKVARWNSRKMPIELYIERPTNVSGYQDSYYAEVVRAMDSWINNVEGDLISYKIVGNPEEANIRVYFVNEIMQKTGKETITGLATPSIQGHILNYYEVKLRVPNKGLYTTALHELGHALGIRGHSDNEADIMYAEINKATGLSQRDIHTLTLLYTLDPDISNFDPDEEIAVDSTKREKLLGSENELKNKKLQEALAYTEKYPGNVLSWANLGKAYYDLKKYEEAILSLKKALDVDPNYINAIETLAFTYKDMGNTNDAIVQFSKLVSMQPENIAFANNYAYYLIENKRNHEARSVLQNLINRNPQAEENENIKQLLNYLNGMQY